MNLLAIVHLHDSNVHDIVTCLVTDPNIGVLGYVYVIVDSNV